MSTYLKSAMLVFFIALACSTTALAQGGGGRGRFGAAGASGGPPPVQLLGGRFKAYPQDAADRGLPLYNTNCGYCHGERAKGGKSGPDLVVSDVSLHDEDGIGLGQYLKGAAHQSVAKLDLPQATVYDIAVYIHSRITVAALNRGGDTHPDEVLKAGNADAGNAYFNGAGGCTKCHSVDGNLKGVGAKYDAVTLQDRIVMPQRGGGGRGGRGGFGAAPTGPPGPLAITATVTLPGGQTFKGIPLRVTDFDVTLRFDDGSTQTWARNNGVPKVDLTDPLAGHFEIMKTLKDSDMHNLTAYLATLK